MNRTLLRLSTSTAVFVLFLSSGLNLSAQSTAPADLLRQAYAALAAADHDYQGHRVRAMKQIEAAGTVVGISLAGNGKGHEQQGVSDQQLHTAQSLLQQARPGLPPKAQKHVDKALAHLSTALSLK